MWHSTHKMYFIVDADLFQCVLNTQLDDSSSSPNIVGGCIWYKNLLLIARPSYVFVLDHRDQCDWRCVGVTASFSVMAELGEIILQLLSSPSPPSCDNVPPSCLAVAAHSHGAYQLYFFNIILG